MTSETTKAKTSKTETGENASLIYVRNLDAKANKMLATLKSLPGFKRSNAANVMIASYNYLQMRDEVRQLRAQVRKLELANEQKDQVYSAIKDEILRLMEDDISSGKKLQKEKEAFYKQLRKTGKKMPKALSFGISSRFNNDYWQ